MGLKVNGTVITGAQRFPITGGFGLYQHSVLQGQRRREQRGGPCNFHRDRALFPAVAVLG